MTTRAVLRGQVGANLLDGLLPLRPTVASVTGSQVAGSIFSIPEGAHFGNLTGRFLHYRNQTAVVVADGGADLTNKIQVAPPFTDSVEDEEAELWGQNWNPTRVNSFINQAITYVHGGVYETLSPIYHILSPTSRRVKLSDDLDMIREVHQRYHYSYSPLVFNYARWEGTNVDETDDYNDYRIRPSTRLDGLTSAGHVEASTGFEVNLSGLTHLEGWVKSSVANTLTISIRSGSDEVGSLTKTLAAGEWTYMMEELPTPHLLLGIDAVRLSISADAVLWVNGLWAINHDSIQWTAVDREMWYIQRETREFTVNLPYEGVEVLGGSAYGGSFGISYAVPDNPLYSVMRIVGGRNPQPLEEDADETNVPASFLTAKATQLAYSGVAGGPQTDPERFREQAVFWAQQVAREERSFPMLSNVRIVH